MTIAEWIGTAVLLAVPYLLVGVLWTLTYRTGPAVHRILAGAVDFNGVHDMTRTDCRIEIRRRTARWDPAPRSPRPKRWTSGRSPQARPT